MKAPRAIGPFVVRRKIGTGGMAEVFEATRPGVDGFELPVAVKRILPHLLETEDFGEMFQQEANVASRLHHGNICQVYSLGRDHETLYMALEYVDGKDLQTLSGRLREVGERMPVAEACTVLAAVCEGLDYAHHKLDTDGSPLNLVHRDVSPPNVIVSFEGQVKLIDFGLAKINRPSYETKSGTIKGKLAYLSPEQMLGDPLDGRSDIYAVGIVMFELLTGRRMFGRDSDIATLRAVKAGIVPSLREFRPDAPAELEQIMLRALARDPGDRYQSAGSMREALLRVAYANGLQCRSDRLGRYIRSLFPAEA